MKKILLIMMCMFLLVGMVSAAKIKYEDKDMKVNFKNSFLGIGISDLGSVELKSHKSVTEIRKLGAGENQAVMFYDFNDWKLYPDGLGEVIFTNMSSGEEIEKDYYFAELTIEQQPKYKTVCEDKLSNNGLIYPECSEIQNGFKQVEVWKRLETNDIPNKNTRIALVTDVKIRDYIDAVWTIAGKKVKKHAVWTQDLNTDIYLYFKFDENATTIDSVEGLNTSTTASSVTGKIGNAYQYSGAQTTGTGSYKPYTASINAGSVNFWMKTSDSVANVFSQDGPGTTNNVDTAIGFGGATGSVTPFCGAGNFCMSINRVITVTTTESNLNDSAWHMVTITVDGTTHRMYIDGLNVDNTTTGDNIFGGDGGDFGFLMGDATFIGTLDEYGIWNRSLTATEVIQLYNGGTGITYKTTFEPTITLNFPTSNLETADVSIIFNGTVVKGSINEIANVSLILNGVYNETNSSGIEGDYLFSKNLLLGVNNWTYESCDSEGACGNETLRAFTIVPIIEEGIFYNVSSFETAQETFIVNVTTNGIATTSAEFFYNDISQGASTKIGTNTNANFSNTIQIQEGVGNKEFYWKITNGATVTDTTKTNQSISLTNFSICDGGLTTPFFNVSFQDESDLTSINASIPTSSFVYYLGSGTVNKTYTFSSVTEFANFTFCATPTNRVLNSDSRIQYKGSSYPQRTYNPVVLTYENTTTNKTLYLLGVADGIYVTFQVINLAHEPIIGANVNATRVISDETVVVGDGITDSSGSVTFWLNPDFQHLITFGKTGFPTTVFLVTPTQTSYTITMGAISTEEPDYTRGISKVVYPNQDFLDNATEYDFNFTLSSTFWTVTEFGFTLTYENGTIIKTTSSSSNGGTLSANDINVTFFLTNESHIDMDYYYIINATYINSSRTWEIISTEGRQFSLWRFFTDISLYINSGSLFGFDNFGRILLSIIVLIMVAGGVSLKYGIRSDTFTMGVIFGIVLLLDYGLNFFPQIKIGSNFAINNFATFIVAIILIAVIIKEERL